MAKATCSVEGCDRSAASFGFCDAHYRRWRKTGDPNPGRPIGGWPQPSTCSVYNCNLPAHTMRLCSRHYYRLRKYGTTTIWLPLATDVVVKSIDFDAEDGHHIWHGTRTSRGYGTLGPRRAPRFVWELTRGPIPDGLWILHHCDVTSCVNPDHLYVGDHTQNVADAKARNRYRAPLIRNPRRGSRAPSAVLTEALVLEIRRLYAEGARQVALAQQFGVIQPTISQIVRRATWTHI